MNGVEECGDNACWLAQVCAECGALREDPTAPCWRCGAVTREGSSDPAEQD